MTVLNPYLNFPGNAEEAFLFYRSIFGGEFRILQRYKDGPSMPGSPPPDGDLGNKILHIALPIGANTLMASDAVPPMCPPVTSGTNIALSLHPDSEAEARRIFEALSANGHVLTPFQPMFWGALFGMCTDPFGIQWMVSYELPKT